MFLAPVQVFGGCCLNVYSLEAFLSHTGGVNAGPLVSLAQLVSVCASATYPMLDIRQPRRLFLKRTRIPMAVLFRVALLFYGMSVLGNSIYSHGVSVPVQITFRSSSVVFSMAVNAVFGKKHYSRMQVASAVLMTAGSFLIISQHSPVAGCSFMLLRNSAAGFVLLTLSSLLGAFLGLYTEQVFAAYGHHWQEVLFYNHFLSVPLLLLTTSADLSNGFRRVFSAEPRLSVVLLGRVFHVSKSALFLGLNSITQIFCARGVNRLASSASSLTVTVVLLVRKFLSLVISAWVFGKPFNMQGVLGSSLLIAGTLLYARQH